MPLFLPSDADSIPTEPLKRVEKAPEAKPNPSETWVKVKPGIYQNGLGQKKTEDFKPAEESLPPAVTVIAKKLKIFFIEGESVAFDLYDFATEKAWKKTLSPFSPTR